ncbi:hypothetical protein TRVA0_001S02168 [Trichomonascus vanleenenianus]|uniref:uncharacterized protein n=1 Tax=Trichomonascus vanleenenianus TaxID=2268995 RepID=UPI003ECB4943
MSVTTARVHKYHKSLIAIEHSGAHNHKNAVLFIGGLGDGPLSVPYVAQLAETLDPVGWAVIELQLTSSYSGWGAGSVVRDSREIGAAVAYFQREFGKIVLMGHSTGCQDALYYATLQYPGDNNVLDRRPTVSGVILQASVSDREAGINEAGQEKLDGYVAQAQERIARNEGNEFLPSGFLSPMPSTPITAKRYVSLFGERGEDDLFSSYLTDSEFQTTFGRIRTNLLVCYSGSDEFVPDYVDKEALVARWKRLTAPQLWSDHSGVIANATHNYAGCDSETVGDLVSRVLKFVTEL